MSNCSLPVALTALPVRFGAKSDAVGERGLRSFFGVEARNGGRARMNPEEICRSIVFARGGVGLATSGVGDVIRLETVILTITFQRRLIDACRGLVEILRSGFLL